jgi:hypothetical protein
MWKVQGVYFSNKISATDNIVGTGNDNLALPNFIYEFF